MHIIEFSDALEKQRKKLKTKNPVLFNQIQKKIYEIADNPEHYKPLRNKLAGFYRIQFGSYVLIYTIKKNIVRFVDLDHHDIIYKKYNLYEKHSQK